MDLSQWNLPDQCTYTLLHPSIRVAYLQVLLGQELLASWGLIWQNLMWPWIWGLSILGAACIYPGKTSMCFYFNKHWEQTDPKEIATLLRLCSALPRLSLPYRFPGRGQILVQCAHWRQSSELTVHAPVEGTSYLQENHTLSLGEVGLSSYLWPSARILFIVCSQFPSSHPLSI